MRTHKLVHRHEGFSLIELLIVCALLAILLALGLRKGTLLRLFQGPGVVVLPLCSSGRWPIVFESQESV